MIRCSDLAQTQVMPTANPPPISAQPITNQRITRGGPRERNLAEPLLPTSTVRQTLRTDVELSLVDVLIVTGPHRHAVSHSIPLIQNVGEAIALNQARRIVHSELQHARMKSVTSNLVMRVQFNCPAAGQFRMLELLGTPTAPAPQATAANRCSGTVYPFPPADQEPSRCRTGRTHPPDRPACRLQPCRRSSFDQPAPPIR